jgi:hypothetical protein
MKTILIILASCGLVAGGFIYQNRPETPLCRGGSKFHNFSSHWEPVGQVKHTFGPTKILMGRRCHVCGYMETKESR